MDRQPKQDSASTDEGVHEQQNDTYNSRSLEAAFGNIPAIRDNVDEGDGQRRSLSLDEDGGTHFENSDSLETVVRRNGAVRDDNPGGAFFKDAFEDNDILFNPAQRLNFDDDEEEEDEDEKDESDDEDGNKRSKVMQDQVMKGEDTVDESDREDDNSEIALVVQDESNEPEDGSDYLHHRPWVSGSDLVEDSDPPAIGMAQSQSQNVRIIEGHDSSLLDDGNPGGPALYNFSFLQPQMSPLSPVTSFQPGAAGNDNENQNLYDTLETVPTPYGAIGEHMGDTNTSEYYSLMATNSSGNISDSFWQQEEVLLQRSRTGQLISSHPVNQNLTITDASRDQSPPRNFQPDHIHVSSGIKESHAFGMDGTVNAPINLADSQDGLNMELSEEGLSQSTQIYAQPISDTSACNVELSAVGSIISSDRGDAGFMSRQEVLDGRVHTFSGNQQLGTDHPLPPVSVTYNPRGNNSQPKNLAQNKAGGKVDMVVPSGYPEAKVAELNMDRRQAGAGSSTSFNDKNQPNKNSKGRATGPVSKKSQIRRPAVQGSASAGDQKRPPTVANSHPANSGPSANATLSGKITSMPARVKTQGSVVISQGAKPKQQSQAGGMMKLQTSSVSSGHTTTKHNQEGSPLASSANSHTSLTSVASSNSRVGGVGKESHHYQSGQAMSLPQLSNSHPGNAPPHRTDNSGQLKQSTMLSAGHPLGAFGIQHPPHGNFLPQRAPQINQMHELHAGDVRTLPHPQSQGFIVNSHAHIHGKVSHQYPPVIGIVGNAQAMTNAQAYQMASFPSQALSPCGSESSHHSYNREAVVTQMEAMKKVMNQSASSGNEMYSCELQSIEDVRNHLHSMLHIGTDNGNADLSALENLDTASELLTDQPVNRQLHFDTDSSSMFGNKVGEDMSEILENFPAFSSKMFSDVSAASSKNESHIHSENQYLRETLEKERYRRKHCEDQIQRLNTKLLEIQQQLAVAVSTDKRKDSMIEQLDKQLAKVVEGWKKREADKDEALRTLTEEKGRIEESLQRQQAMINNFEHDLAQTVDELKEERTKSSETIHGLRKQLAEATNVKDKAEEKLNSMTKKCESMTGDWETMKKSQAIADMRAQQAQEKLIKEQDAWLKKEQELLEKIAQVKEANQKVINMEKIKLEEQKKRREAAESEAQELKAELKKLVLDTEQLVREKESQKMEVSIMEAKFESAQRKLEADLHAQMEKEIADQASEFHTRLETAMEEANERHRTQVAEIHKRHQKDMERQMAAANVEVEKKEEEYKKQIVDLEGRLSDARSENSSLKQSKLKLESQRMEILTKLQFMMQSQWNEAVSLLVSTPQKKGVQSSFLSATGGLQLASLPSSSSQAPQTGINTFASSLTPFSSLHKAPKVGDSQNGRKSSSSSSGRERNDIEDTTQLDRVEEYLHRLNVQAEAPMSGDDSHTSESGSTIFIRGDRLQETDSVSHALQQSIPGQLPNQTQHAFLDNDSNSYNKPSHSPSQLSNQHQKQHLTQINGNLPTSIGLPTNSVSLPQSFQALPIRSPQQMTRLAQGMHHGSGARVGVDPPFKENPTGHGNKQFYSQNHSSSHVQHPQLQQENFFLQYHLPPNQSNLSKLLLEQNNQKALESLNPSRMPGVSAHVYGDSGDQVNHSQPHQYHQHHHHPHHGIDHNPNLYNSNTGSSAFVTSSPSGITPISSTSAHKSGKEHNWSPDNAPSSGSKMFVDQSPPGISQGTSSYTYNMESPLKWSSRQGKKMGIVNASLSPPVRQTAEKDQTDAISEASSGVTDPKLDADYSHLSERMDKHSTRHEELQHYIQMLLQKAPGSVAVEPERDIPHDLDVLESSRDLTDLTAEGDSVDLDLNDTAQAQELTSQLTRFQELRERQQSCAANQHQNWPNVNRPPHNLEEYIGENGVMNAEGLSEISQLLSLYREQWESNPEMAEQVNTAGQLIQALRGVGIDTSFEAAPRNDLRKQPGTKGSPKGASSKKPRDNASNKPKRKSANQVLDVSITTTVDSLEGSHNSAKGGNVPAVTAKKSQEVIKDTRKVNSTSAAKATAKGGPVWK